MGTWPAGLRARRQGVRRPGDHGDLARRRRVTRGACRFHIFVPVKRGLRRACGRYLDGTVRGRRRRAVRARAAARDRSPERPAAHRSGWAGQARIIKRKLRKDAGPSGGGGRARAGASGPLTRLKGPPRSVPMLTIALRRIGVRRAPRRHGRERRSSASSRSTSSWTSTPRPPTSDRLADTVDYSPPGRVVVGIGVGEPHRLLESLARRMVDAVERGFRRCAACVSRFASSTRRAVPATRPTPKSASAETRATSARI